MLELDWSYSNSTLSKLSKKSSSTLVRLHLYGRVYMWESTLDRLQEIKVSSAHVEKKHVIILSQIHSIVLEWLQVCLSSSKKRRLVFILKDYDMLIGSNLLNDVSIDW